MASPCRDGGDALARDSGATRGPATSRQARLGFPSWVTGRPPPGVALVSFRQGYAAWWSPNSQGVLHRLSDHALDWDVHALAADYYPLARSIAWKVYQGVPAGGPITVDDLISAAGLGLMQALERYPAYCAEHDFDIANRSYLVTYVSRRMKGACLDWLRGEDYLTRSARARAGTPAAWTLATARRTWRPGPA